MNSALAQDAERVLGQGRPGVALLLLDAAAHRQGGMPERDMLALRARAHLAADAPAEAARDARAVLAGGAESGMARLLPVALLQSGAPEEAVAAAQEAIDAGMGDARVHAALAVALLGVRGPQAARDAAVAGLAACPGSAELRQLAGRLGAACRTGGAT